MIERRTSRIIETERLILRDWRDSDRAPWAAMNADPRVREFFPGLLTPEQSDTSMALLIECQARDGFTFWAVEEKATGAFAGFTGLLRTDLAAPFAPCVEIGWRLATPFWKRGLATEAARGCLDFGFGTLGLTEIVAFTTHNNLPSRRVMERLGMTRDAADDFIHPSMPTEHPLQPSVLYRIGAARWATLNDPHPKEETPQ
jgi:ribosomal-protein-alanine N-acetyltransferase